MAPSLRALGQKASACGLREERRGDGRGGGGGWDGVGGRAARANESRRWRSPFRCAVCGVPVGSGYTTL